MKPAFVLLAVAACAMAACTGKSADTSTTASSQTVAASASPAAAASVLPSDASSPQAAPAAALASPVASGSAVAVTAVAAVSYTDLGGVFGQDKIVQLAQLGAFETPSGTFQPYQPIKRRDFARWMFRANNAIFKGNDTLQVRPVTPADESTFKDLPKTDPDFPYAQALANAGVSVGFPDKTFRPDQLLTREQMVAMKTTLDDGGPVVDDPNKDLTQAYYQMPQWKDKKTVAPEFAWAVQEAGNDSDSASIHNVSRVYGAIAEFKPKKPVTRAEAALELWVIRPHQKYSSEKRSAADALKTPPSAAP
jgi:hypothetical protein